MLKKLLTFIMLIFIIIGFGIGIYFAAFSDNESHEQKERDAAIFGSIQTKQVEVNEFFTYGTCFNVSGVLSGVSKDNFESVKLYITDGKEYEKTYKLDGEIKDGNLTITTENELNTGLKLDDLTPGEYVVLIRLKLNNSVNPKYYSLSNKSEYGDIEYYTITKDNSNNKVNIGFKNKTYDEHEYSYLGIEVANAEKPEDVYDIVLDSRTWWKR